MVVGIAVGYVQFSMSNSAAVFLACNQGTRLEFEVEKGASWFSFSGTHVIDYVKEGTLKS